MNIYNTSLLRPPPFNSSSFSFCNASRKDGKAIVDMSIPFLFPYIVVSNKDPNKKMVYNTSTAFRKQEPVIDLSKTVQQSRIEEVGLNGVKSVTQHQNIILRKHRTSKVKNKVRLEKGRQSRKKSMESSVQGEKRSSRIRRKDLISGSKMALEYKEGWQVDEKDDTNFIERQAPNNQTVEEMKEEEDETNEEHHKQRKELSEEDPSKNIPSTKEENSPTGSNAIRKSEDPPQRPSSFALKRHSRTQTSAEGRNSSRFNVLQQRTSLHKGNLSRFAKRNAILNTRNKVLLNNLDSKQKSKGKARVSLHKRSFLSNLIEEEEFNSLSVIDESELNDLKQVRVKVAIKLNHNRTTIESNTNSRLGKSLFLNKPSQMSSTRKTVHIYKISANEDSATSDPKHSQYTESSSTLATTSHNKVKNKKKHESPSNASRILIQEKEPSRSVKSIKSAMSTPSIKPTNLLEYNRSLKRQPNSSLEIQTPHSPCDKHLQSSLLEQPNKIYSYLNHLIDHQILQCPSSSSSLSSIPSLTILPVHHIPSQIKTRIQEQIAQLGDLQRLNENVNQSNYQALFHILQSNESNGIQMNERKRFFKFETKALEVLRLVETRCTTLEQGLSVPSS